MSTDVAVGPNSPKKKYHCTKGKGSLEESIHNVKPLDISLAHQFDFGNNDPSESSDDEVIEVEDFTNVSGDDDSYEESVEELEEIVEVDDDVCDQMTESKPHPPPALISPSTLNQHSNGDYEGDDDRKDLSWQKPDWTKTAVLRSTDKGQVLKDGATLSVPITKIAEVALENKDLSFKKPDWTTNVKLKATGKGDVLKSEGNLAKPITALPHLGKIFDKAEPTMIEKSASVSVTDMKPSERKASDQPLVSSTGIKSNNDEDDDGKKIEWEKPDWTKKAVLKGTLKGEQLKAGATLSRPIGGIKPVED